MNKSEQNEYLKSNEITTVSLNSFSKSYYKNFVSVAENRKLIEAQNLIDYLCNKFNLPYCQVSILNSKMTTKKGDYNTLSYKIRVWNLTAKTGQIVSNKAFLDVLLHEFIHHYDIKFLGFKHSPHTSGFYKRITDLKTKLQG